MQAVVSGQPPLFPALPRVELGGAYVELKNGAAAAAAGDQDSDDEEYVYVSRLAEQIAHAMLDEEEDINASPHHIPMPCAENVSCASLSEEVKFPDDYSVSHFAATWRDNGPSEWDCFYTPMLQQDAKQSSFLRGAPMEEAYMFRRWSSLSFDSKKTSSRGCEQRDLPMQWNSPPLSYDISFNKPKESIGTGVFLPKIVKTGSSYRRKVGLHSKSAYAPRSKY